MDRTIVPDWRDEWRSASLVSMTHAIAVYDPGHFHAALLFFRDNPRVERTVHVYAPPGPDVARFIALVESFNTRDDHPTDWNLESTIGDDALARLVSDRPGDIVVLAGRNGPRLALMHHLHDHGFHVLADKPWMTDSTSVRHLDAITVGAPLAVDIMTGRQSVVAELRNTIIGTRSVFGALVGDAECPALEFTSRHHLLKRVDGKPLRRPAWFYDVAMQGDGMVDIHSHYVDQAQWIIADHHQYQVERDFKVMDAERWTLPVPLEVFQESTGEPAFPGYLASEVDDDLLFFACNGRIDYRLLGIPIRQHCAWGLREPEGGSDLHGFKARGENAELSIEIGPETNFKSEIRLRLSDETDFLSEFERWRAIFQGLEALKIDDGYTLVLPPDSFASHEAQFPKVLDQYLDLLDSGVWPATLAARIRTRYTLLARAREIALAR